MSEWDKLVEIAETLARLSIRLRRLGRTTEALTLSGMGEALAEEVRMAEEKQARVEVVEAG